MCVCMYYKYIDIRNISSKEVNHKMIALKHVMFTFM